MRLPACPLPQSNSQTAATREYRQEDHVQGITARPRIEGYEKLQLLAVLGHERFATAQLTAGSRDPASL